jgi:hypothetical protein
MSAAPARYCADDRDAVKTESEARTPKPGGFRDGVRAQARVMVNDIPLIVA